MYKFYHALAVEFFLAQVWIGLLDRSETQVMN